MNQSSSELISFIKSEFLRKFKRESVCELAIASIIVKPENIISNSDEMAFIKQTAEFFNALQIIKRYQANYQTDFALHCEERITIGSLVEDSISEKDCDFPAEAFRLGTPEWYQAIGRNCDDKSLNSEISKIPDMKIVNWRKWIVAPPNTHASQTARLSYIIKWGREQQTLDLYESDSAEAAKMKAILDLDLKMGNVEQIGKKSIDEKKEIQSGVHLKLYESVADPIDAWTIFGQYLPVRRVGDLAGFRVVLNLEDIGDAQINAFIKSTQTFIWRAFKNVAAFGEQSIPVADVVAISFNKDRAQLAIDWLNNQPNGSKIVGEHASPSVAYRRKNGFSCNDFRHFYETIVSPTLNKQDRAKLRYWLCHSASTAETHYVDE